MMMTNTIMMIFFNEILSMHADDLTPGGRRVRMEKAACPFRRLILA
jgi:hypothetical protein